MDPVSPEGMPNLTERLNQLIEVGPYRSNAELVQALRQVGADITPAYISILRSGKQTNPSARVLHALSLAFDVDPGFWFDAEVVTSELERLMRVDLAARRDERR